MAPYWVDGRLVNCHSRCLKAVIETNRFDRGRSTAFLLLRPQLPTPQWHRPGILEGAPAEGQSRVSAEAAWKTCVSCPVGSTTPDDFMRSACCGMKNII